MLKYFTLVIFGKLFCDISGGSSRKLFFLNLQLIQTTYAKDEAIEKFDRIARHGVY